MAKTAQELIMEATAKKAVEQKQTTPKDVVQSVNPDTPVPDAATALLLAELAALKAANLAKDMELEAVKAKLPVNDYITLRGSSPTFSVVIEGKRCLFVNFLFITRDRILANQILIEHPTNITEVKEDEQSIQFNRPEVSQVI